MATITLVNGTRLHVRPAQITMVSGDGPQSKVSGFGPGQLHVQEGAEALLNRLYLTAAFEKFAAPNDTPIWICRDMIALVREPLEIENGHAVVSVAGENQALKDSVAEVRKATGL